MTVKGMTTTPPRPPCPHCGDAGDAKLRQAAHALAVKMRVVHESSDYRSVWTLHAVHGGRYDGPTYERELANLEVALAAPAPSPSAPPAAVDAPGDEVLRDLIHYAENGTYANSDMGPVLRGLLVELARRALAKEPKP